MSMREPSDEVRRLLEERARARVAKDYARADEIRDRVLAEGWEIRDRPSGAALDDVRDRVETFAGLADVPGAHTGPDRFAITVCVAMHGWPEDVRRLLTALAADAAPGGLEVVVVDLTMHAEPSSLMAADAAPPRVVRVDGDLGHADAWNVAARLARGGVLCFIEPSLELGTAALLRLAAALDDPGTGLVGPFGLRRQADENFEATDDEDPDALEYVLAMRRADLGRVGDFDSRFRFYRNLDVDYSHQVAASGLKVRRMDCGEVVRHEHRLWTSTPAAERDRLSRKNFNHYLDRWRRNA
jgi:GT2 family glycosyltransferase